MLVAALASDPTLLEAELPMPQVVVHETCGRPQNVVILGSTGSIGRSALSVLAFDGGRRLRPYGLAARASWQLLLDQARTHRPRYIALTDPAAVTAVDGQLRGTGIELLTGPEGIERLAADPEADRVVSAIVGAGGLARDLGGPGGRERPWPWRTRRPWSSPAP